MLIKKVIYFSTVIFLSQTSFAESFSVKSEFLQFLDFESRVIIHEEAETAYLKKITGLLLEAYTDCKIEKFQYSYRIPEFVEVKKYYKDSIFSSFSHALYGDVWQFERLDAVITCGENIESFKMTHFIEDGVRRAKSQGLYKTEDYWMEVRISYFDKKESQQKTVGIHYNADQNKLYSADRESLDFSVEP